MIRTIRRRAQPTRSVMADLRSTPAFSRASRAIGAVGPRVPATSATELKAVLAELVVVREGERSRKVPKLRALMTALVNRGLKGDHRAAATLVATLLRLEGVTMPAEEPAALAAEDARILERALGRALAAPTPAGPEADEE